MSDKNREMIDKLTVGFNVDIEGKSSWWKIESKVNNHKIYVQTGDNLKKIETTLPIKGQEGTADLPNHNGKITCRIVATRENLAKFMPLLNDASVEKLDKKPPRMGQPRPVKVKAPKNTGTLSAEAGDSDASSSTNSSNDELKKKLEQISAAAKAARTKRLKEETGDDESDLVQPVSPSNDDDEFLAPDVNTDLGARELAVETGVEISLDA